MNQKIYIAIAAGVMILLVFIGVWFLFFRSTPSTTTPTSDSFGTSANNSTIATTNTGTSNNGGQPITSQQAATQKIFQITQGPIAGATLIQTLHPTTTLARYINQEDGHAYDLPLDVPGAVPRIVSNVTIPGASRALWLEQGSAAILQYLDGSVVKSVYLGFPPATTSPKMSPTRIQFLPDNIIDLAASPDGKSVAYVLKTSGGSDGYVAKSDGTGAKKVFSLPLSQVLVSWPAQGTLLAQSKSAAGVPGIAFSIDAKSGAVTPLLYSSDLTAIADSSFSNVVYQTDAGGAPASYSHNIKSGSNTSLSFAPYPEKCMRDMLVASNLFCAAPFGAVPSNYIDRWHLGTASAADAIYKYNITTGLNSQITAPGSGDGGVQSDILEMALSPDEHYLSFTTKGSRALWGVRLTQ